jgi:hypothetical protein
MPEDQLILDPTCKDGFNEEARKLSFDPEAYAHHIAELDLTEPQKLALMRTVWDLMVLFVDAGFGIDAPTLAGANNTTTKVVDALKGAPLPETPEEAAP